MPIHSTEDHGLLAYVPVAVARTEAEAGMETLGVSYLPYPVLDGSGCLFGGV